MHTLTPTEWVQNYADYLYSHAFYKTNNQEQAEDLVQETFFSAFKNKDSFKGEASEKTWLTSILKNKIIDFYRKKASYTKAFEESSTSNYNAFFQINEDEQFYHHWKNDATPAAFQLNGLEELEQKELQRILMLCFGNLPEQWNKICHLKLIDQEETELVCKTFNISSSNLWVIIHRAKLQLRDCLQKNWLHD